jgi:hypothetical protein
MSFFTAAETADLDGEITALIDAASVITRVTRTVTNGALGQTETLVDGAPFAGLIGTKTLTERTTGGALIQTTELQLVTAAGVALDTGDVIKADGQYYAIAGRVGADSSLSAVHTYRVTRADVGA